MSGRCSLSSMRILCFDTYSLKRHELACEDMTAYHDGNDDVHACVWTVAALRIPLQVAYLHAHPQAVLTNARLTKLGCSMVH